VLCVPPSVQWLELIGMLFGNLFCPSWTVPAGLTPFQSIYHQKETRRSAYFLETEIASMASKQSFEVTKFVKFSLNNNVSPSIRPSISFTIVRRTTCPARRWNLDWCQNIKHVVERHDIIICQ
jgi:hypothetical protein